MSEIEKELRSVTKLKPEKYTDRQDYLAAVARYLSDKLSNDEYDSLSDAVVGWFEQAAKSHDAKDVIPEFPDKELPDEPMENESGAQENPENVEEGVPTSKEDSQKVAKGRKGSKGHSPDILAPEVKSPADRYANITGEKNRYGVTIGTKAHDALMLFEKGRTMAQITEALEGRYYNLLGKMTKDGHLVEKLEGGVWKLTHKDSVEK